MNDLAQFFRALCRRWSQASGVYDIDCHSLGGREDASYVGEWYRVGPWHIVIAKETPDA
jgi:hypothetical protein